MSSPRSAHNAGAPRRNKVWWWVAGAVILIPICVVVGGKAWIDSYFRGDKFRQFVGAKAGHTLEAETEIAPMTFSGQSFYTNGMKAHGTDASWFSEMRLDQIRADVSARRFWDRVWDVDEVSVQRARIKVTGERLPNREKIPASREPGTPSFLKDFIPNRVEVNSAVIQDAGVDWGDGSAAGTAIRVTPQDEGWNIVAQGGTVVHGTLPALELGTAKLRYREPSLFVQDAELRQPPGGTVHVSGEVRFGESADLLAKLDGVAMTPYLVGDWRARLHGKLSGEVRVQSPLPARGAPLYSGHLNVSEGQLEAFPLLDQIASFTRTVQYRRLILTRAYGDFHHDGETLDVKQFVIESEGLIRIEGDFTIVGDKIDGAFQVGVTPASLQWLPGSQEKIFTVSRGGYLWTPMRLTGPLDKPKDDLSPRLMAAAKDAFFNTAEDAVRDVTKGAKGAAKGALDLLLGK